MKKSLLLALMLLMATSTLFADRSWNLRKWSAATIDSLTADTVVNWVKESSTRFSNRVAITDGSTLKAKGVPIVETNGLTFGATSASKVRIDFGTNPDRLMLNGSGLKLYVPNCLVGDTIYMVTLTASSTTARGVTTSSNLTRLNALATSTDSLYNKFLVTTAGTATFTTTGGLHFRAIKVRSAKSPILDSAMINENFSTHTTGSTALVHGFAQSTYYVVTTSAIPPTTGTAASATAIIDTVNQVMTVTGSGSGNRGAGVTIPTSGSEKYVQLDFKWFTGNPGSEANKLVDMNFCDASGNCILYFYTENWTGSSNHFHCLNLSPTTIPSGSNRDVPLVAINANKNTLFGQSTTAHNFGVNTNWYHIIARMDFAAKKIVSLKVVSGTDSVTVYNLPFITTVPTSLAKISCATYRNASANSNGTGTSGNGSNAYLAYKFDDIFTTSIDSLNEAAYEKTIQSNYLNNDLSFAATMTAGTKPAAGALGYASGAQNALTGAIATAKFIRDDDLSTATDVANARTSLNTAMATFDAAKLPISDEYLISVNNKYLLATDTSATWVTDKNFGTFFTVTTNPSGYVSFISENKYLTAAGKLSATAASYRMMVNDTTFKLNDLASRTNYVKVDTINTFMLAAVPGLVYKVQEYFPNLHVTTLPAGWGTDKYTKFVSTALNTISAAAITDTIKGALKVTGSGSGDRGIAVTMPTTGTETMVDVSYVWKSSSVMTESNKLEEMNLTDASGNSILYLYTENWPGEKCHIHCLNLKPAQTIGGSNPGNPDVAIAANLGTLPYGKDSLTMPIDTTYKIKARLDFTNKVIVSLSITGNGNSFTATNLPFISTVPASLSRINFATYRNANQNAGGVGTAGNGSTTSMTVYLDSVEVSVTKAKEKEAYYKVYNKNVLGQALPLMQQLASGKTPETGILGYKAGAKTTYATAVTSAKSVYDNASSTSSQLMAAYNTVVSALNTFDAAKTAVSADYLLNNKGKFLVATDTSALYADTTLLGSGAAQKKSTLWTVKTDASGHVTFMNGTNYLQPNGKMGATASNYRFLVNDTTFKLNVVGTSNYLTVGTDSSFSLFSLTIPIKPVVLAALPTGAAVDTTGAMIKVSYNQKIAIKNANGIKVNGVVAPATATGKQLIFDVDLAIKTTYTVTIDSAAIVNLDDETLVANALTYTFTTYSPYLRDKQTMLGAGAFAGTYALFGPGSANGYTNLYKQIAGNDKDSLWCDLSNSLYAQYQMILADTTNKVWNLKNAGSGKYLTYNSTTGKLAMSVSPIGWQISLNASSPSSNDYMSIYTFWPGVSDKDTNYQKAIRVDSMKILKPVANGTITTTDFVICPMLSLTKADIQNYTTTSYIKIGARNTGEVYCQVSGDNKVYASSAPSSTEGSHWKVKRVPNGRYIFQNRLTGGYLTYSNDSTVLTSATYTPGADNQEWVVMAHCDKSGVYYHTIQGKRLVLCEGTYYGGMAWLTQRNSANATASSGGCARMCLVTTGVTYVAGEGKPTISVPTVGSKSITISWNANREANRYIVRAADTLLYSKGDSIGNDPVTGPIYQQIPYLKDSLCFSVDTLSELNSKFANLKTGINYYFTVQAMDSTGLLGVMSDIKTIQTVPMNQFKPAVPTVGEVTMKTVALSWLKNEEATGYVVSYWTKADSSDTKKITTKEASCILPNILASTKVWATLTLKADTLTSIPSDTVTTVTLPYSTLKMTNPVIYDVRSNRMTIVWSAAVDATSYNLYFTDNITKLTTVTPVSIADTICTMSDLTADKTYYMQLAAVNVASVNSIKSGTKIQKTAKDGAPVNVGYFTLKKVMDATADSVQNDPVYRLLKADTKLNVTLNVLTDNSKTAVVDQTPYNVLIIQESVGGGDGILTPAGTLALSRLKVPTLYNKTYAFKAGRAFASGATGAGAEATTGVYTLTVDAVNQSNNLFKGLTFTDNTLKLFTVGATDTGADGTKALNMANNVVGVGGTLLAYPTGSTPSICVNDIPAGDTIGNQRIRTRVMTMGMNFGAICRLNGANMTDANRTLWRNAVYMLGGLEVPTTPIVGIQSIEHPDLEIYPNPTTDYVNINGLKSASTIRVYSTTGQLVFTGKAENNKLSVNLSTCDAGLYLLQIESNGSVVNAKILKK